jgi:hypothetical protein
MIILATETTNPFDKGNKDKDANDSKRKRDCGSRKSASIGG